MQHLQQAEVGGGEGRGGGREEEGRGRKGRREEVERGVKGRGRNAGKREDKRRRREVEEGRERSENIFRHCPQNTHKCRYIVVYPHTQRSAIRSRGSFNTLLTQ